MFAGRCKVNMFVQSYLLKTGTKLYRFINKEPARVNLGILIKVKMGVVTNIPTYIIVQNQLMVCCKNLVLKKFKVHL